MRKGTVEQGVTVEILMTLPAAQMRKAVHDVHAAVNAFAMLVEEQHAIMASIKNPRQEKKVRQLEVHVANLRAMEDVFDQLTSE